MATEPLPPPVSQLQKQISLKEFFESTPPGIEVHVKDLGKVQPGPYGNYYLFNAIDITLHCDNERCGGPREFRYEGTKITLAPAVNEPTTTFEFINYWCCNCRRSVKTYAVRMRINKGSMFGTILKFGEIPPFGVPTPRRLLRLLGEAEEKKLFLNGRKCESQGLGIGAFTYYRRVIELRRNQLFDEIIRAMEQLQTPQEIIDEIRQAKNETRFSEAMDKIKHGLPPALSINGHDPLRLLHSVLSQGIHGRSDEDCLNDAQNIRIVLSGFIERLSDLLKEQSGINAVASQLAKKQQKGKQKETSSVVYHK